MGLQNTNLLRKQELKYGSLAVPWGKALRPAITPLTASQVNYSIRSPFGLLLIRHYLTAYYTPYTNAAGEVIYFDSQLLTDRPHTLEIRVTAAADTYPFILDVISCSLGYGGAKNNTMTTSQSPTSTKTIIGGVIGGVCAVGIIAVLLVFAYRSPNRRARDNQDSDVANPHVAEVLPSECLYRFHHPSQRERREFT